MVNSVTASPSFVAPPGEVADWRLVLLYDAAWATGLADALPATVADAADRAGLEPKAVRAVLDALVAGGLATADADGTVTLVPAATDPATRSTTSVCLKFTDPRIVDPAGFAKAVARRLESEGVAFDIGAYRDAPPGLRIWCGSTVETSDIAALMPWIEWAYACEIETQKDAA